MAQSKTDENPYKVRLVSAGQGRQTVSFDASPTVSENRNVNYASLDPLHAPGQIQVYKNTSSRNFQVSDIRILSRTVEEADRNLKKLWILRSWCMPRFGNSSTLDEAQRFSREARQDGFEFSKFDKPSDEAAYFGTELLGAPPPILYLSAYSRNVGKVTSHNKQGNTTNVWRQVQHINSVPVVIQQLTIPYPNDVDYITASNGTPMPIIMNIDIALMETHSPNAYEAFNLDAYRQGILQGF
jgi:hypothetical protein